MGNWYADGRPGFHTREAADGIDKLCEALKYYADVHDYDADSLITHTVAVDALKRIQGE
jgi:hypothetical protein